MDDQRKIPPLLLAASTSKNCQVGITVLYPTVWYMNKWLQTQDKDNSIAPLISESHHEPEVGGIGQGRKKDVNKVGILRGILSVPEAVADATLFVKGTLLVRVWYRSDTSGLSPQPIRFVGHRASIRDYT